MILVNLRDVSAIVGIWVLLQVPQKSAFQKKKKIICPIFQNSIVLEIYEQFKIKNYE